MKVEREMNFQSKHVKKIFRERRRVKQFKLLIIRAVLIAEAMFVIFFFVFVMFLRSWSSPQPPIFKPNQTRRRRKKLLQKQTKKILLSDLMIMSSVFWSFSFVYCIIVHVPEKKKKKIFLNSYLQKKYLKTSRKRRKKFNLSAFGLPFCSRMKWFILPPKLSEILLSPSLNIWNTSLLILSCSLSMKEDDFGQDIS